MTATPLTVIRAADPVPSGSAGATGAIAWSSQCDEVLDHLRMDHRVVADWPEAVGASSDPGGSILIFAEPPRLDPEAVARVEELLGAGGAVIVCGGAGDLSGVAGVDDGESIAEDHLRVDPLWWWADRFDTDLHAFGGRRLVPTIDGGSGPGADDTADPAMEISVLGRWDDGSPAIVSRSVGAGRLVVVGADPWQSIGRIQQGWPVDGPGQSATDGSAEIGADSILRVDDGLALSLERDRITAGRSANKPSNPTVYPPVEPVPMFQVPVADLWRELVFHLIFDAADEQGTPLAWLHYWPAGVPAIGHLSHDSDLNQDAHAMVALKVFGDAGVKVTWCHCWPGGYSKAIIEAITTAGHEHGLHYNALDTSDGMPWGADSFHQQYEWAAATAGVPIVSNKNHYTRWENWTELYRWCEQVGIKVDESRGPSKPGTVGFPYGTSHVWFPIDETGKRYDVLELPLHSQDLGWAVHESVGPVILNGALAHHGVAHFLYHGTNLSRSQSIQYCVGRLVTAGRHRGMIWWTAAKINAFERARRGVKVQPGQPDASLLTVTSEVALPGAGILVSLPPRSVGGQPRSDECTATVSGIPVPSALVNRHGRQFLEIAVDLPSGVTEISLATRPAE